MCDLITLRGLLCQEFVKIKVTHAGGWGGVW